MDAARQLVRFSIPGAVLLLLGIGNFLIFQRCQGVDVSTSSEQIRDNVAALVGVLATIPVGFIIYQVYYALYGPLVRTWPFPWGGRLVRIDRGSQVLKDLEDDQIRALRNIFDRPLDVSKPHRRSRR